MRAYRATGFPMTVVRPSHTYDTIVPVAVSKSDFTIIDRIRRGLAGHHPRRGDLALDAHPRRRLRARLPRPLRQPARHRPRLPHHLRRVADLGPDPAPGRPRRRRRAQPGPCAERVHRQARPRHRRRAARRQELVRPLRQQQDEVVRPRLAGRDPLRRGDPAHGRLVRRRSSRARRSTPRPTRGSTRSCAPGSASASRRGV